MNIIKNNRVFLYLLFTFICYLMYKFLGFNIMICASFGTIIGELAYISYKNEE